MPLADMLYTLATCVFFMALVAIVSYYKTRGEVSTSDGYFLAGRGLSGVFIAGSMLLTNLSAEQLIGLNGSAYGFNLSSMAWEVTAAFAIIIMALVFLPRYLSGAFTTLPEFLQGRYDDGVRRLTVILFMVGYALVTIPSILYSGSVAVLRLFEVEALLGIGYSQALLLTILLVGLIGALYAIFGGLRAVAVSDTINGVGLLIVGVAVPLFGFAALGEGDIMAGVQVVTSTHKEKLNAIGAASDPTPFATIFTGMIFANLFYWGTNQYVIQRALGAASLAEGQKGVLATGYFKLAVPFIMMVPGVIAFHLYGPGMATIDLAYPQLVSDVLPRFMAGFFLAVLLGAVFSSYNSLLNSAATLFCLDVYAPLKKRPVGDAELIRVAKIASVVIALFSFIAAPLLQYSPAGLFQVIRLFTGFYSVPIIAIVLVGLFTRRVPARAAKIAIVFHVLSYGLFNFVIDTGLHFIHLYGLLFAAQVVIMLVIGRLQPLSEPWRYQHAEKVAMTPWRLALPATVTLVTLIVLTYLVFSPIGVAGEPGAAFWAAAAAVIACNFLGWWLAQRYWQPRYAARIRAMGRG